MGVSRPILSAVLLTALAQGTARAEDVGFDERVRAFLMENPEVILEALEILAAREAAAAMQARVAQFPALFSDPPWLVMGSPDAPVRVVEFFDYKCVPCKAVHPGLVAFVEQTPEVRIEMRHLPILTPGSERAARFALAVREVHGDAVYRAVHNRLWEVRGPLNAAGFERIARELGLDFATIAPVMEDAAISARIDYNREVAIALEILGTPAFVTPRTVIFGETDIDVLAASWLNR